MVVPGGTQVTLRQRSDRSQGPLVRSGSSWTERDRENARADCGAAHDRTHAGVRRGRRRRSARPLASAACLSSLHERVWWTYERLGYWSFLVTYMRRLGDDGMSAPPISVRHATEADAAAIGALHVRAWQWAFRGLMADAYLDGLSNQVDHRTAMWRRRGARSYASCGIASLLRRPASSRW